LPTYVTEALTRHAGLAPTVVMILGLYESLAGFLALAEVVGMTKVLFVVEVTLGEVCGAGG
jgi:hypothetical protein